jgi:hypothetical protein
VTKEMPLDVTWAALDKKKKKRVLTLTEWGIFAMGSSHSNLTSIARLKQRINSLSVRGLFFPVKGQFDGYNPFVTTMGRVL